MSDFVCPICKKLLNRQEKVFICENGHSFDISKEGYIHLLPVNKMHSKVPGDTKEMVLSRRNFLQDGYYEIFSNALNREVVKYASAGCKITDAGCGEGYYTGRLKSYLDLNGISSSISGFDISKIAVKYASRKYKDITFAVASIFDIPIADESSDIVISIFAPIVESEFCRILKKGGKLIIAVPGEYHLWGLKTLVYDKPYINELKNTEYNGFKFLKRITVKDNIYINNSSTIDNLFAMTPYFWKTDIDGSKRVKACHELNTQIHFDFLIYEKQ